MNTQYMVEFRNPKFFNLFTMRYFDNLDEAVDAYDAKTGKVTLYKIKNGKTTVFWTKDK